MVEISMVLVINLSIAAYVVNLDTNPGNVARVLLLIEHRLRPVLLPQPLALPNARLQPK
jgi:hypothetical protein